MSVMTWFCTLEQSVRALRRFCFSLIFIDELALVKELFCFFYLHFKQFHEIVWEPENCLLNADGDNDINNNISARETDQRSLHVLCSVKSCSCGFFLLLQRTYCNINLTGDCFPLQSAEWHLPQPKHYISPVKVSIMHPQCRFILAD